MQASNTLDTCIHAFSQRPFTGFPVIGPGVLVEFVLQLNDIYFTSYMALLYFMTTEVFVLLCRKNRAHFLEKNRKTWYHNKEVI